MGTIRRVEDREGTERCVQGGDIPVRPNLFSGFYSGFIPGYSGLFRVFISVIPVPFLPQLNGELS
jgi:hypothetical protein